VAQVKDWGCIVALTGPGPGLRGIEGRVQTRHLTGAPSGAAAAQLEVDPRTLVRKGQAVRVKVLSVVGERLTLSMKDVDQATGRDLLPQRQRAAAMAAGGAAAAAGGQRESVSGITPLPPGD